MGEGFDAPDVECGPDYRDGVVCNRCGQGGLQWCRDFYGWVLYDGGLRHKCPKKGEK